MSHPLLTIAASSGSRTFALLLATLLFYGCANITSISRTSTLLPSNSTTASPLHGRAIHLDIKQRVLITKPTTYRDADGLAIETLVACAEPSPDALSAFASAVGAGASDPTKGAASASSALHEAAASIGLRTQSITLMRDSLYRICEAYYNGQLTKPQVMLLMARSQDLTTTVLAVEQLTGAVVASQAALGGSANASGSSTMLANSKALEQIRALEQKALDELKAATQAKEAANAARDEKEKEVKTKEEEWKAADDGSKPAIKVELNQLKAEHEKLTKEAEKAASNEDFKKRTHADYTSTRVALQQQLDSAVTSSNTSASGTAVLVASSYQSPTNAQALEKVAQSVERIATAAIGKNYVNETCVAVVTQERERKDNIAVRGLEQLSKAQEAYLLALSQRNVAHADVESADSALTDSRIQYDTALAAKKELNDEIGSNLLRLDVTEHEIELVQGEIASLQVDAQEPTDGSPTTTRQLVARHELDEARSKLAQMRRQAVETRAMLKHLDRKATSALSDIERLRKKVDASQAEYLRVRAVLESGEKGLAEAISKQTEAVTQSQQRNLYETCLEVLLTTAKGEKVMLERQMSVGSAQSRPDRPSTDPAAQ